MRDSGSLRALMEQGSVLLPQFASVTQDLFAALFKYNVLHLPQAEIAPSARVNRVLLDGLLASAPYEHLKTRTQLDEARAGLATVLLAERALELLKSEKLFSRRDLVDQFDLARDEQQDAERIREAERAEEAANDSSLSDEAREEFDKLRDRLAREARMAERRRERKAADVARDVAARAGEAKKRLEAQALDVAQALDEAADEAESWGRALGARGAGSAARSLELGRRLALNPKLRKLAALLGRMREHALALRHRLFERPTEEVYEVETGATWHGCCRRSCSACATRRCAATDAGATSRARCCSIACAATTSGAAGRWWCVSTPARRWPATRSCGPKP